jgi:ACS family tartrate transporter-like MFS transporter
MPAGRPQIDSVLRKVTLRLLPFLLLLFVTAYLDRVNVGFAALQMNHDLQFSNAVFGFGSSMFFLGYCLFETPSNVILARVGARLWIARIMISWGALASAMMFVRTPTEFYVLRFALGVAEAGFYPGVVFYLSRWFPQAARSRALAFFLVGIPVSGMLGGPLSGVLLDLDGIAGLAGWKWLFLLEGLPPVLLGVVVVFYLPETPAKASWLKADERAVWINMLQPDPGASEKSVGAALLDPRIWAFGMVLLLINTGFFGYLLWLPQFIQGLTTAGNLKVGFISAAFSTAMAIAMIASGIHSDRGQERRWHSVAGCLLVALGFGLGALVSSAAVALPCLSLVLIGVGAFYPPYWTAVSSRFRGSASAAAIGLVASIGNSGGFFGPSLIGVLKGRTGSHGLSFLILGALALCAALLCAWVLRDERASASRLAATPS